MPLLRRQQFKKQKPPPDLRLDEEVFHCTVTNEIFRDYEEFFNRIILCNSLVWSCAITGKPGLTYQEALESEERARRQLAAMPEYIIKPVLYLATLTHRTRLNDLNDDVFVYAKDRFFIGEIVEVQHKGEKKTCQILRVMAPSNSVQKVQEEDDCIVITDSDDDTDSKSSAKVPEKPKLAQIEPGHFSYEVKDVKKGFVFVTRMGHMNRKKGLYTRDKSKLFLKQHCESDGMWKVKDRFIRKYKLQNAQFTDFFAGPPPEFPTSEIKRKRYSGEVSKEDEMLAKHKKEMKEKKKKKKEEKKKAKELKKMKEIKKQPSPEPAKMTMEERAELREKMRQAKLAEKEAKKEETRKKLEEERQKKKEEREKKRDEQRQKAEELREWSKPRDDMECDDLKDLPTPKPVQALMPPQLFGDAVMVLEYLKQFKEVIDPEGIMPQGLTIDSLGKALLDSDTNGMFAELLMFLLLAIFNLTEEEEEEEEELEREGAIVMKLPGGLDENVKMTDVCREDLVRAATAAAQWPQLNLGKSLSKLQMDSFTVTEILRLHFLSSGSRVSENNAKFRYQQRGGFTPTDDAGMEFLIEEPSIIKALATCSVYDLEPSTKMKILSALVRQLLTYVACRDLIDDNMEKCKQLKLDLRTHQNNEQRREKDEATFWYRKRLEERAKQKELEEQLKEQRKKAKEERLRVEEIRKDYYLKAKEEGKTLQAYLKENDITLPDLPEIPPLELPAKKPETTPSSAPAASDALAESADKEPERRSTRQKAIAMSLEEPLDIPTENIEWDKLTPADRARMKQACQDRENAIKGGITMAQQGCVLQPLGRDRTYRRYWLFSSLPGLFVEDDDEHINDDVLQPVPQRDGKHTFDSSDCLPLINLKSESGTKPEEKCGSDKENESFDGNTSHVAQDAIRDQPLSANSANVTQEKQEEGEVPMEVEPQQEMEEYTNVYNQIKNRGCIRWSYFNTVDELDKLIERLNPRGYREGVLRQALIERKVLLQDHISKCPAKVLSVNKEECSKSKDKGVCVQNIKSRNRTTQGLTKNDSAHEFLELNFREMLLDLEERLYVGGLGVLKIDDRVKWRDAIESGSYSARTKELCWGSHTEDVLPGSQGSPVKSLNESHSSNSGNSIDLHPVVKDLARALLQIKQMVYPKYLNPPLGTAQGTQGKVKDKKDKTESSIADDDDDNSSDTPKVTFTDRWEESLMGCTSLAQLFLHLSTLEQCLAWSKSALHACCKICRRKGDADKMLLCDGCDRGHHMFCLKPPVKKIPEGDWFCPACRPKELKPRTPRKRRKSFYEQEEQEQESSEEEEDSDEEDSDSDSEEEDSSDEEDSDESDEETEEDTEEEEVIDTTPAKIKLRAPIKKSTAKSATANTKEAPSTSRSGNTAKGKRSLDTSLDRSSCRSGKSSARNSPETSKPSSRTGKSTARTSLENGKRNSVGKSGRNSARNSLEPERPSSRTGGRNSLGKRRREEQEAENDNSPVVKKTGSKSRGGEGADQMKLAENLVHELIQHDASWPFLKPVTKREAPDYFDIIKKPMDLSTIRAKINKYEYDSPLEILEDVQLTFSNCEQYNLPSAEEYKAGQRLVKVFVQRVKQLKLDDLIKQNRMMNGSSPQSEETSKKSRRR